MAEAGATSSAQAPEKSLGGGHPFHRKFARTLNPDKATGRERGTGDYRIRTAMQHVETGEIRPVHSAHRAWKRAGVGHRRNIITMYQAKLRCTTKEAKQAIREQLDNTVGGPR
jgi:hypothetical protein